MTNLIPDKLRPTTARINLFFGTLAALLLWSGCASTSGDSHTAKPGKSPDKEFATFRLHLEQNDVGMGIGKIQVFRADPVTVVVEKEPFLNEGEIAKARVIQSPLGGHLIQVEYNHRGKMALQLATAPHPGSRIAVWARWTEGRWLGAPVVQHGIEDGTFTFTPDCSFAEAERIVRGLNNMAIKLENQPKPKKIKAADKNKKPPLTEEEEMFK